jgi:hypothetical protein
MDISGRLLKTQTFFHSNKTQLNPELKLAKGIYLVQISNQWGRVTRKVVVK